MKGFASRKLVTISTIIAFGFLSLLLPSTSHGQWVTQELPEEDHTLTYVLLGLAAAALIVGIIVMSNSSSSNTPSDSSGIHVDSAKVGLMPQMSGGLQSPPASSVLGSTNPCLDSLYLVLDEKQWNSMTKAEREYHFKKGEECDAYKKAH